MRSMRLQTMLAALLATALLAGPSVAQDCEWTTSEPEITLCQGQGTPCLYVENEICQLGCIEPWHLWIYEESNGLGGLQRSDEWRDDTCDGLVPSDTVVLRPL